MGVMESKNIEKDINIPYSPVKRSRPEAEGRGGGVRNTRMFPGLAARLV